MLQESLSRLLVALLLVQVCRSDGDSASLPAEHRGGFGGVPLGSSSGYSGPIRQGLGPNQPGPAPQGNQIGPADPWPLSQPDMPQIKNIQVQCEKTHMRVNIDFDRPFYGMIFSKGHYSDPSCVHLQPGSGTLQAQFEIFLNSCGMSSSNSGQYGQPSPTGTFVENTLIVQYDPLVQEVWDQARRLRCTWYDYYEKAVTFRPFQVDMLNAVTANFLGDNLQCWMQVQVGKGPWASEVSGIVKIGQTMTMVLAIKDDENKFDMLVRNCVAHDGKRAPIQLVDGNGCVTRPKIMSRFQKIKNFGSSASVVSYAYFQAFKFPDSMNVNFQCVIQVCRFQCPEPACGGSGDGGYGGQVDPRNPAGGAPALPPSQAYQAAQTENKVSVVRPEASASQKVPTKVVKPHKVVPYPSNAAPNRGPVPNVSKVGSAGPVYPGPIRQSLSPPPVPIPQPVHIPLKPNQVRIPLPPQTGGYASVNREGVANLEGGYSISGQPRAIKDADDDDTEKPEDNETTTRRRRAIKARIYKRDAIEMTDIETTQTIQVVAPGDVAFNLNGNNETVVVSSSSKDDLDENNICMSVPGFVAGVIMLLLVLIVACIVAIFLYSRVRSFNSKGTIKTFVGGYDNPEFVKVSN